jgi:hypothetical protein
MVFSSGVGIGSAEPQELVVVSDGGERALVGRQPGPDGSGQRRTAVLAAGGGWWYLPGLGVGICRFACFQGNGV